MNLHLKEISDKHVWENFHLNGGELSPQTSFFQSWNWGEFEKSLGKDVYFLGVVDLDGDQTKPLAISLATVVKAKRGNFLHLRNGPVARWDNPEIAREIIDLFRDFAAKKNLVFMRVSPLVQKDSEAAKLLKSLKFVDSQMHDVDAEITWMLDLTKPDQEILDGMRKNTRYYIRRAAKDGVEIIQTQDPTMLKEFFPIYLDTIKRQQWNAYPTDYIQKEFEQFVKDDMCKLFLAKYDHKYIAGAMFIYFNGQAYYHHSGSLTEFNKIPAQYLLQWESIIEAKRRNLKTYNFFGIAKDDDPNHPWSGLTFFKKGFGGYQQNWMHAQDLPLKPQYWLTHYYEKFERKRRGY